MLNTMDTSNLDCGIFELTNDEIDCVSGGSVKKAAMAATLSATIGAGIFGSGWMAVAVGAAWGIAPVAVVAMAGLGIYAGYQYLTD